MLRSRLLTPLARSVVPRSRLLSTSVPRSSATPDWQELIGGREVVDRKRAAFENKYKAAVERKARLEGLSVEELKARKAAEEDAVKAAKARAFEASRPAPAEPSLEAEGATGEAQLAGKSTQASGKKSDSPVKVRLPSTLAFKR